jgi:hypothetical protein
MKESQDEKPYVLVSTFRYHTAVRVKLHRRCSDRFLCEFIAGAGPLEVGFDAGGAHGCAL